MRFLVGSLLGWMISCSMCTALAQKPPEKAITVPSTTAKELTADEQALSQVTPSAIFAETPTLPLIPYTAQAHPGVIWLRSTEDGLHIFGQVKADRNDTHWPEQKADMLASDHVEVWLATEADVPMPPIGWGNQFGIASLDSAKDCTTPNSEKDYDLSGVASCPHWFNEQLPYRQSLRRLFVRQWLISAPGQGMAGHIFEDFAANAYAHLQASLFPEVLPVALAPRTPDGVTVQFGTTGRMEQHLDAAGNASNQLHQTGYTFHAFIPYTAFPPARQFTLANLYVMVDVFSSAPGGAKMGSYSTTSATREWGKPATFNRVRLEAPRTFSLTPCRLKPEAMNSLGIETSNRPWFFPTAPGKEAALNTTFDLFVPEGGYLYEPNGVVSPEVNATNFFWHPLPDGATLCGPDLGWSKEEKTRESKFSLNADSFDTKMLPDGWVLVQSGPYITLHSAFGSGQCGACEIVNLNLYAISPDGTASRALQIEQDMSGEGNQPSNASLYLAKDWSKLILERIYDDSITPDAPNTSVTYCLTGHVYKQCGESKNTKNADYHDYKQLTWKED